LRIEVLGSLRITGNGVTEPTRASHRRLLSLLLLEAGHRISTERLIDMHWGENPPDGARAALQAHISALRRLLTPALIRTEGYGYRLALDFVHLDAVEFEAAAAATREAVAKQEWDAAVEAAAAALALWRGPPYAELRYDDFAIADIARLEETYQELWEIWAGSLLSLGRPADALPELERLVVEHPYRERLWEHLMTARYRLGRHAEAVRAYRQLSEHLAEIGLEPGPSIRRLEEKILLHHEELAAPAHNLPVELTSFVGREEELGDVAKLLGEHRLVTLTGVGGSGKTRLGIEIAGELLRSLSDGCRFVGLAGLRDPELIPVEICRSLGVKPDDEDPLEALVAAIGRDELLLVLDNCEHLRDGAGRVVVRLLGGAGRLRVLATSREPLHVPGEVVYEIPPLAAPPDDATAVEAARYDSVRLFVDRAGLLDPRFSHDDSSLSAIGSICRRLDGIPLAIELAAAKVRSFSLELIDRRLGERLFSLTGNANAAVPRHQTLEAAMAWSFDLLDDEEQRLFARLAVFQGGFDVDMIQHVAADPAASRDATLRHVESLVDKSLIAREQDTPDRYRLLEPVREFARDQLIDSGDQQSARLRHLEWCVGFATDLEARVYGPGRYQLLDRLALEIENLDSGLELAVDGMDAHAISRIAGATAWHWLHVGSLGRGRDALRLALANVGQDDHRDGELRGRLAHAFFLLNDTDRALDHALQARDSVQDLPPSAQKVAVLRRLASLHSLMVDQDPRLAIDLAREALSVAEATGEGPAVVGARAHLGSALSWAGEVEEGLETLMRARAEAAHLDDRLTTVDIYVRLFVALYLHPDHRRNDPRDLLEELLVAFPLDEWIHHFSDWPPYVFMQPGEWDRAEEAIQASRRQRSAEGYVRDGDRMTWGTLCWMRGDLDGAARAMVDLEDGGVNPRWYHDYYPLCTDIAADAGDVEAARRHAEAYLVVVVDESEEHRKLGALNPLVRAEVDAALRSAAQGADLVARAQATVARMRSILEEFPPPTEGSVAMETHGTHLAFAEAELSRVTGPDPELWRHAAERADFIYFRLYARIRLAEALRQVGRTQEASERIDDARAEAKRLGAEGLLRLIKDVDAGNAG
jgi:predicted ATPase/DNA-binding SARP family transcriptional activator